MSFTARAPYEWKLRTRTVTLGPRTRAMGIVNVTPDSFSDGGRHATTEKAVTHALHLLDAGADLIDIGGESTRPGSAAATGDALSLMEEQARVLPVIAGVLQERPGTVISVDTYRAATAKAAVLAGAEIVNDVSGGLWDADMLATCAELGCGVIVMHTRGLPSEWAAQQALPAGEVAAVALQGLQARVEAALAADVAHERIVADPGFGFGKRGAENWALLARFDTFTELGVPLMAGLSRKGFLLSALDASAEDAIDARDALTHAANEAAILGGAHLLRVHDVRGAVRSAAVPDAILNARLG